MRELVNTAFYYEHGGSQATGLFPIRICLPHVQGSAQLTLDAWNMQGVNDEGWGVDNVLVYLERLSTIQIAATFGDLTQVDNGAGSIDDPEATTYAPLPPGLLTWGLGTNGRARSDNELIGNTVCHWALKGHDAFAVSQLDSLTIAYDVKFDDTRPGFQTDRLTIYDTATGGSGPWFEHGARLRDALPIGLKATKPWIRVVIDLMTGSATAQEVNANGTPINNTYALAPWGQVGYNDKGLTSQVVADASDGELYGKFGDEMRFSYATLSGAWTSLATVSGSVALSDFEAPAEGQEVVFDVLSCDGSVLETKTATLGSGGTFSFDTKYRGLLSYRAKGSHWLRQRSAEYGTGDEGVSGLSFSLVNGDCDGDNEVGISDYALLSASYGFSDGDPGFDTRADLNGDAAVDIADYAILSANYGEVGD